MIIDDWWLIIDCLHTENTEGYGCPQADEGGERKLKRINRELKEMGPQADGGGEQVSINDERLMIKDGVHTENTDETDVRKRTGEENSNYQKLDSN